jgi:Protein of unknown function (DUF2735)
MSAILNQESAKIYQFPTGGRAALGGRSYAEAKSALENAPRVNEIVCSGSWYHEEAIRESVPGFKPTWEH